MLFISILKLLNLGRDVGFAPTLPAPTAQNIICCNRLFQNGIFRCATFTLIPSNRFYRITVNPASVLIHQSLTAPLENTHYRMDTSNPTFWQIEEIYIGFPFLLLLALPQGYAPRPTGSEPVILLLYDRSK